VIWGDDLGWDNVSQYGLGKMGYTRPGINRIGKEGVMFTEHSSWPHGGTTPFRGEKMSTYEGGMRVVSMVRWPGHIKPGTVMNGVQMHMDMFTTFAAIAGVKDVAADMMAQKKQYIDGAGC
jgi:arylsulfatase A-like enzyme